MQSKTTFFQVISHFIQTGFHFILINVYAPINIFISFLYFQTESLFERYGFLVLLPLKIMKKNRFYS